MYDEGNILMAKIRKIYVYECPSLYPGYVKIGETTKDDVEERIWEQFPQHPRHMGKPFNLLYECNAETSNGLYKTDKDVHLYLMKRGVRREKEWFQCTIAQAIEAINETPFHHDPYTQLTSSESIRREDTIKLSQPLSQIIQLRPYNLLDLDERAIHIFGDAPLAYFVIMYDKCYDVRSQSIKPYNPEYIWKEYGHGYISVIDVIDILEGIKPLILNMWCSYVCGIEHSDSATQAIHNMLYMLFEEHHHKLKMKCLTR